MFSMLPEAADFSLRTDRSAPRFEDQPFYQYNDLLIAQLEARMLADCTILGVYEALVVKMDGGAKDKARIKVLGPHGRRALHMYLNVHIKSEREDRGSSAKRPAADGDAASSTDIFQRFLSFRADGAGKDDTLEAASGAELQGRLRAVFPGEAETKLKNRIIIEDKFDGIKDIVDAIDVENYVVTVSDYAKVSQVLYRVIMAGASAPVLLTAAAVPRQNGFDLFQQLLIEYGKSSSARTVADMSTLKMTYSDAVKAEPGITVSGFVNKLVKARLALGSIDDEVFKSFLISSFEGSVMDGYITQVKNTDGISAKTVV